ncbi:DUF6236 family protein [Streptomyces sp. NRRL B-24484]|uniref:DUF6236 family protein n=1 Tax=Streptomyces sp. NRRL B-24484 TaxID=1463833 RepID=UPI0004C02EFA|nr:DUF6236 family protein [Streptomyces sp. NRRL B-24484]
MRNTGLYYPYVHLRDEQWAKAAALYWKRLARVVPEGFPVRDGHLLKELQQAEFLVNVDPAAAAAAVAPAFIAAVEENAEALRVRYGTEHRRFRAGNPAEPGRSRACHIDDLAGLYPQEVPQELTAVLRAAGLARRGGRYRENGREMFWLVIDPALAWAYKCALTEELARRTAFVPVTDQVDAHAARGGWSSERIAEVLLGGARTITDDEETRLALMAVRCVLPADLHAVPVEKIIRLRTDYADEFDAFAAAIDTAAGELRETTSGVDDAVALGIHLKDTFDRSIAQPLESLRKAMKGLKLETMYTALTLKAEATAGGAALGLLGGGTATAVGAGLACTTVAARQTAARQRDTLMASSPVGYLLRVEEELTPRGVLQRTRRAVVRAAGLGI